MKAVYRYELKPLLEQSISMPKGATALGAYTQDGTPYVFALVDTGQEEMQPMTIVSTGTGQAIQDADARKMRYIGSTLTDGGALAWHVFERRQ